MTGIPIIPNSLKRDTWKREKSIIAQTFKPETGIGKALDKVAVSYAAVEWQYFDPHVGGPLPKPRTLEDLDDRLQASRAKHAQIQTLIDDIEAARDLCTQVGDKWERSSIVPKASRIFVQQTIPTACNTFIHDLNHIGTAISKIPKYKLFYDKTWSEMVDDAFMAHVTDGKPVLAKVALVEARLNKLKIAMKPG